MNDIIIIFIIIIIVIVTVFTNLKEPHIFVIVFEILDLDILFLLC